MPRAASPGLTCQLRSIRRPRVDDKLVRTPGGRRDDFRLLIDPGRGGSKM